MKSLAAVIAAGLVLAVSGGAANAQICDDVGKIGVLTDMSSLYADATGVRSTKAAARWSRPIEMVAIDVSPHGEERILRVSNHESWRPLWRPSRRTQDTRSAG
jgi:hypothetical protein